MKKLILIFLFVMLLSVQTISADEVFQFDNYKNYNPLTKTATIVNTLGLKTLAEIQLTTPSNVELPLGYNNFANITVTSYTDYSNILNSMNFYDKKISSTVFDGKNKVERNFDVLVREIEEYSVDDHKLVPNLNGTGDMWVISGSHLEKRVVWKKLDNFSIKDGEKLNVELWIDVKNADDVEWIPDFMGVKIPEWGSFNASGGTLTWDGIYQVNTFLTNGTFTVTGSGTINILIVGGGGAGGGGSTNMGAGGGAGGWLNVTAYAVTTGAYPVIVGDGGVGVSNNAGGNGANSSFNGALIAWGGGGGGAGAGGGSVNGVNGGSGGGAGRVGTHGNPLQINYGAATGFGMEGGNSTSNSLAGGGGAGLSGTSGTSSAQGGNGGNGLTSTIYNGTALWYAGGGGGGGNTGTGVGGLGGGGNGTGFDIGGGEAGTPNTGGGGGGGGQDGAFAGLNGGSGIVIIRFLATNPTPTVTLDAPANYSNTTNPTILFNTTVIDNEYVENVSLYVDGVLLETSLNHTNGTYSFTQTLTQGKHNWSILAYNNNSNPNVANIAELWVDSIKPALILSSPENKTYSYFSPTGNNTIWLNWSANDTNTVSNCKYSTNANATNYTITCSINNTKIYLAEGNYTLDFYASDPFGNVNYSSVKFEINVINYSISNASQEVYVTQNTSYWINTTSANASLTSANLYLNGTTRYTGIKTGDTWNVSMNIPATQIGNTSFIWELTYLGVAYNTTAVYTNIGNITWILCDGTYTSQYLNYSFKDENNGTSLTASIPTSTFAYYLGTDSTINKTYTKSTTTNEANYTLCFAPANKTVNVNAYIQYKEGTIYPQRIADPAVEALANDTITNKTLYLLYTDDGNYVTFQVVNSADQLLSGVVVNASREISGSQVEVAVGTTGDDGTVTFWLNPDFSHTFTFVKTGQTTYITSFLPNQASYTITMGSSATTTGYDFTRGISIDLYPTQEHSLNGELWNNTIYPFCTNLTSSYWAIEFYGFNLRLANGTIVTHQVSFVPGAGVCYNYNVNNQTIIYMDYFWSITGNYSNGTKYWIVSNIDKTSWSIKTFFTDLNNVFDDGIFGLDAFGRYLIAFLILFFVVGILGYKFGVMNPIFVSCLTFSVVFFLDVITGLIPAIRGIDHLVTYIAGLIMALVIIGEATR